MKYTFPLFALLIFSFYSCDKGGPEPLPAIKKIIRSEHVAGQGTYFKTYEYDSKGRLTLVNNSQGIIETYSYADGIVDYEAQGGFSSLSIKYYLNSDELAEKAIDQEGNYQTFQYNSDKQIIRIETYEISGYKAVFTGTWVDGNQKSSTVIHYNPGVDPKLNHFEYSYVSDQMNTLDNEYMGLPFLGKESKNPVSLKVFLDSPMGTITTDYTYQFDENGYIVQVNEDKYYYED